jgi:hypothetical protein
MFISTVSTSPEYRVAEIGDSAMLSRQTFCGASNRMHASEVRISLKLKHFMSRRICNSANCPCTQYEYTENG